MHFMKEIIPLKGCSILINPNKLESSYLAVGLGINEGNNGPSYTAVDFGHNSQYSEKLLYDLVYKILNNLMIVSKSNYVFLIYKR